MIQPYTTIYNHIQPYTVKVRDVSSTVVKLQLLAPFAVARTQSVCCQQELTQGLEPQASVDMTC